jgi:DNA-binding Lrp family transcriptional regulator
MKKGQWTFLSNHGRVLAYIGKNPSSTIQEIAIKADLSITGVQQIITELEEGGYLSRLKAGRRNQYKIHSELPMRHHLERHYCIGGVLQAVGVETKKGKAVQPVPFENCKVN